MDPSASFKGTFTSAVPGTAFHNNTASPCSNAFVLTWNSTGFTALSIQIEGSDDNVTFAAFSGATTVIVGTNPSTNLSGAITIQASATLAFIRVNVTSVTGTGSIAYQVYGYNGVTDAAAGSSGGSGVTSFNTRTGAVVATTGDYTVSQVTGAAPLASPTFTGVPAAPTAGPGTSTTQLATTAFVQARVLNWADIGAGTNTGNSLAVGIGPSVNPTGGGTVVANQVNFANVATSAPILASNGSSQIIAATTTGTGTTAVLSDSPALTGNPTAPTQAGADNTTKLATTAFVQSAISGGGLGTVTNVSFTGGIVSVANPTSTPAMTVAGTSGGIPYFSTLATWASSAALTANGVVIGGGAGVAPSSTAVGTAGQVLTSNGTGVAPTFQTAAAGGSLESHTASNSAELDFTSWLSSNYDEYEIRIIGLVPATNNVTLGIQFSTNGGSTYDTGANYTLNAAVWLSSAVPGVTNTAATSAIIQNNASNDTTYGLSMKLTLANSASTSAKKALYGNGTAADGSSGLRPIGWIIANFYNSNSAINAFRILASSGNLASGTVRVYGVPK